MRQWIDLVEARKPVAKPGPQPQQVYDRILKAAALLGKTSHDFRSGWDQSWAVMIRHGIGEARANHTANEQSEVAHAARYSETYQPQAFNLIEELLEVAAKWWQTVGHDAAYQLEVDAKYEYEDYQDGHPRVEQSDEMSALYDQLEMARQIYYKGSDTLDGMMVILDAIENYVGSLQRYVLQNHMTRSAEDFIKKAFPAFMTICLVMGATKS